MHNELYYTETGSGQPLVLLHGNGEDGSYFTAQIEYFSKSYRVIAVDTRGHGKSPRGAAPFTLNQFALDLKCFFDRLRLSNAVLLGFSDGANIALLFALQYPYLVEKLILNGANLHPGGVKLRVQLPIVLGWCAACLLSLFDQKAVPRRELLGLMVTQPHIRAAQLHALRMPVLVIAGTRDMIRTGHTRRIAAHIPSSRLQLIPGDHFIAAGNSAAFNKAVQDFLCT